MRNWTAISPIPDEAFFSKDTAAKAEELNKRIRALLNNRAKLDAERKEHCNDLTSTGNGAYKRGQQFKSREMDLLQEEVAIREDLAEFDRLRHADMHTAADESYTAFEKVQAAVRKKLVKIGYHDVPVTTDCPGKITPGMIFCHPDVRAAREANQALCGRTGDHDFRKENAEALAHVKKEISRVLELLAN